MLLTVKDVRKSFPSTDGPVSVLDGIDMALAAGETLALQGVSGSGKRTLMHVIGGLEPADSGAVIVAGEDLAQLDEAGRAAMRRQNIGVVFQQFNLIPSLDAAANIRFQARLSDRVDEAQIARVVDGLGLGAHLAKYPEQLSGGQQKRVAIARTLATRPALVLADGTAGTIDAARSPEVL